MSVDFLQRWVLFFLITSIFGCSNSQKTAPKINNIVTPIATAAPITPNVPIFTDASKYGKDVDGNLFDFQQQADRAILVDSKNKTLVIIALDKPSKFRIQNSAGKDWGYIVSKSNSWKLKNPEQSQVLYTLKKQSDGDYKLKDAANNEIYRIKVRQQGFEIQTPDKKLIYQVQIKTDRISLINAANKTIFSTKSELSPIAVACFGFDVLTREQQAGLAYAVNLTGGQ